MFFINWALVLSLPKAYGSNNTSTKIQYNLPCSDLYIRGQRKTKNDLQTLLGLHGSQLHPHQLKQDALQSVIPPILSDNITYIEVVRGLLVANCVQNYIRALPSWIRRLCNRYRSVGSFLKIQTSELCTYCETVHKLHSPA